MAAPLILELRISKLFFFNKMHSLEKTCVICEKLLFYTGRRSILCYYSKLRKKKKKKIDRKMTEQLILELRISKLFFE